MMACPQFYLEQKLPFDFRVTSHSELKHTSSNNKVVIERSLRAQPSLISNFPLLGGLKTAATGLQEKYLAYSSIFHGRRQTNRQRRLISSAVDFGEQGSHSRCG